MSKREAIDPKSLTFTDEAPPAPVMSGERYSPYAEMVRQLMTQPGKWAKVAGAGRKAEKIHKQFPGIERRSAGDDLWLRYVTASIVAREILTEYASTLDNGETVPEGVVKAVTTAVQKAGKASAITENGVMKQTEFFVPAMFDGGRTALRSKVADGE